MKFFVDAFNNVKEKEFGEKSEFLDLILLI